MDISKKNVLITGASSGIGLALAQKYAEQGNSLFLVSSTAEKLKNAADSLKVSFPLCEVSYFVADVADENSIRNVFLEVSRITAHLDILICNAGTLLCGRFETNTPRLTHRAFEVNYWGMHYTVYHFLPLLKASPDGHLAFVSSVAGYTGLFGYSHYAPSKFAIAGLAECLRMELKDYQISVSVIYPPDTETPMLEFERLNTLPECRALSKGARSVTPEQAAATITNGIDKRKFEIYFNFESRLIPVLKGLLPSVYYCIVDRIVQSSRKK